MADGNPNCELCGGEGRFMQNPTGDHDGTSFLSCPLCQTQRLREESKNVYGARLNENSLRELCEKYGVEYKAPPSPPERSLWERFVAWTLTR